MGHLGIVAGRCDVFGESQPPVRPAAGYNQLFNSLCDLYAGGPFGFYDYFCHWEAGDPSLQYVVDLSGDPCRLAAGRLALEALLAEIELPGSGAAVTAEIPLHCSGEELSFGNNCPAGPNALACLTQRIADLGRFLTTPGSVLPTREELGSTTGLEAIFGS